MGPSDRPRAQPEPPALGPTLDLSEVSGLLSVPEATIRAWDRLHPTQRDVRGGPRYTLSDVAALRRFCDGPAGSAEAAGRRASTASDLCRQLLAATDALDADRVAATLERSLAALGAPSTMDDVLLPTLREIGIRWSRGRCSTDQEQLVTRVVETWLARQARRTPPPPGGRPVVLACGPLDQHTLALDAFEVLLRQDRFDCRNLGAQTSVPSLLAAVERSSAQAVVLVSHLARNRAAAASALHAADRGGTPVFYAGAAFRSQATRRRLPGTYLRGSLGRAAADLGSRLRVG